MTDDSDVWYRRYRVAMAVVLGGFVVLGAAALALRAGADPAAAGALVLSLLLLSCVGAVIVALSYLPRVLRSTVAGRRLILAALVVLLAAAAVGGVSAFLALLPGPTGTPV